jgi:hypothetical protein
MKINIQKAQEFGQAAETLDQTKSALNTSHSLRIGTAKPFAPDDVRDFINGMQQFINMRREQLVEAETALNRYRDLVDQDAHVDFDNRLKVLYGISELARTTGIKTEYLKQDDKVIDMLTDGDLTVPQIAEILNQAVA